MQLLLHKHLTVKEELHYGLDVEAKVEISFLAKQYSKKPLYIYIYIYKEDPTL